MEMCKGILRTYIWSSVGYKFREMLRTIYGDVEYRFRSVLRTICGVCVEYILRSVLRPTGLYRL
jgi:hypothetical protein